MKVKQTVAAVCLAAIMATSVGASAGGAIGHWQTRTPRYVEGGATAWSHGLKDRGRTVYSFYQSAWSELSAAMVFYNVGGCKIDSNKRGKQARALYTGSISSHEEFWFPEYKGNGRHKCCKEAELTWSPLAHGCTGRTRSVIFNSSAAS